VLAVLLMNPNKSVRAERIATALWGEDAPATAVKTVQVYVSRLRKALGDAETLVRTPAGYRLRVRPGELDAERFAGLCDDGRRALKAGQAERAATVLREALSLWRGTPYSELAFEPFAQAEIARLEEQRLAAVEERVEADLAMGRHGAVVVELRQLVAANPTRERLAAQLMLALYRSGRQSDALEAFTETRQVLVGQIGVEPGPDLRRLQEAILRQDLSLQAHDAGELPHELRASGPVAGRERELARLREWWERARGGHGMTIAVTGVGGIGKSRLAAELAGELHHAGAIVAFCSGRGQRVSFGAALRAVGGATRPTLLVVDEAGESAAGGLGELQELKRALANLPVLALLLCETAAALAPLRTDGEVVLMPLDVEAIRAIAISYAPGFPPQDVPVERLRDASAGVPRRINEVVAEWARREAARRVGVGAGRAAARRVELHSMEAELADDVEALQSARGRLGSDNHLEPMVCPFKGLASFEAADAQYFFGRERLVAELVAGLVGAPLMAVVGPSGSGKSSVLRAGLLPALAGGVLPSSQDWTQVVIRPGEHPLQALRGATDGADATRRFVVAVDQFEETFTACQDEHERAAFVDELVRFSRAGNGVNVALLAVRADCYGRCAAYPELSTLLARNHVLVGPLRRDELRRAIECPAERVGLRVEPELADALVADVENEFGGLPLLSAALLELWQRRDGRLLRLETYQHTGGVRGAVARLAEEAFSELDPVHRTTARAVLMRLVAEGSDDTVERRRVPLAELGIEHSQEVAQTLAVLTDRRLLTVSTGTVEVAHEALLREWPRLRGWIEEGRDSLRLQRSLSAAAEEWRRLDRDEGALLRGARLAETSEWRDARSPTLSALEREFLHACAAARKRERTTRRRRMGLVLAGLSIGLVAAVVAADFGSHERDVAQSRDLATKSSSLLATDRGLALALAFEALRHSSTAQAQAALRQATLEDRATHVVSADQGLLFGLAVSPDGRLAATAGTNHTVGIWNVRGGRRIGTIRGYADKVRGVSFSSDDNLVASVGADGEVAVGPAGGGERRIVAQLPSSDVGYSIDFGADSKSLVVGTYKGTTALVRVADGVSHDLGPRSTEPINVVSYDDTQHRLLSAGDDGVARIWGPSSGPPIELPDGSPVSAASFSHDGTLVATGDYEGYLRVWDARDGHLLRRIRVGHQQLTSVGFSDDGQRVVTAAVDGVICLVANPENTLIERLHGHEGVALAQFGGHGRAVVSAGYEDGTLRTWIPLATSVPARSGDDPRFSSDGTLVVSGDTRGSIHIWNPETGEERNLAGHTQQSIAQFSPDAKQVVSASWDGTVRRWDVRSGASRLVPTLPGLKYAAAIDASGTRIAIGGSTKLVIQDPNGGHRLQLKQPPGIVYSLVFSRDGKHLLTGSDDGAVRLWSTRSGRSERTRIVPNGAVRAVDLSAAGSIAAGGSDGTVRVWTVDGEEPVVLVGHDGPVETVAFNGRGDRIVSAGDDGTVRIWDARSGDGLVVLDRHTSSASADFSPTTDRVVSAGHDGTRLVDCEVCGSFEQALSVARTRARRTLSAAERQSLLSGG
jgi:WD40 repeat protein/DNA-binding SARP family transcriptional activator